MTRLIILMCAFAMVLGGAGVSGQDWPQWRGPNRDNKVAGFVEPKSWPKDLAKKWTVKVGVGESSPTMVGDKIFTFGRQGGDEVVTCLDAATGKEVWSNKIAAAAVAGPSAKQFPGTRSTPAVGEGKVCTLGANGTVTCTDAATGKTVWTKDTKKPQFYTSTSPIIVDGKCIVFGDGLTAYDLKDGAVKWKWGSAAQTPYGSPVLMTVDDVKTVVTPSFGALAGIRLADGKDLWQIKIGGKDYFHHYSTPVIDGRNVIYSVTPGKGGGKGSMIAVKVEKSGSDFKTTELWNKATPADKYHTPVLRDGLLYGVNQGRNFYCLDAKTGTQVWADTTKRGECGATLDMGTVMLASESDNELVAFRPSGKGFSEVAKYTIPESWCVPIVVGNRIYVKDRVGSLTLYSIE
jgi:outer membrane protein assembly factor BamB